MSSIPTISYRAAFVFVIDVVYVLSGSDINEVQDNGYIGGRSFGNIVMSDLEDSTVTYTEAPQSPDYVPGPEHLPLPVYVPYVPEPVYPEFMLPEDDVLPAEEQLLPDAVSPITDSPGYITEFDLEEYPEEDDEDPEDDPADYPTNRDDDVEEEEESSGDDADDEDKDEDKEEEEHIALTDFVPPPNVYHCQDVYQDQDTYFIPVSGQRAFVVMIRAAAPSTYIFASRLETPPSGTPPLLPIPLPTPSLPLLLPSTFCPRFEVGESSSAPIARPTGGFRVDYGFVGTLDDEIRRDPVREVGYGITDTWDEMVEDMQGILAVTDVAGLSQRMTYFVTTVRQDTDEIYGRLDDAQDDRSLMSGQLNMLRKDRRAHACTARIMESEARLSCEAWVQSMDASDTTCSEVRALQTTVLAQQSEIRDLRATDRRR
ncbi:hypothetical protein Tco_1516219 [Tanacetum coccineum]